MKNIYIILAIFLFTFSLQAAEIDRNMIFLHHSTGSNIWGPNGSNTSIPDEMQKYNSSDLNRYNDDIELKIYDSGWPVNPWNNDWFRWHDIFKNQDETADINDFLSYKCLIIKSCYPSSNMSAWGVKSDTNQKTKRTVENYKWHWRNIVREMAKLENNFFAIWTNAPLNKLNTNETKAGLSSQFCKWAKDTLAKGLDPEIPNFPSNIYIFDYFHHTADANGFLKQEYVKSGSDSHPNSQATEDVAPLFVKEISDAFKEWEWKVNESNKPSLILPSNNLANYTMKEFKWEPLDAPESKYQFWLSNKDDFEIVLANEIVSDWSIFIDIELEENTQYFWKVRSYTETGESAWSETFTFFTGTNDQLELIFPIDNAENLDFPLNFSWKERPGSEYSVMIKNLVNDGDWEKIATTTETIYTLEEGLYGHDFLWKVVTDDETPINSEIRSFSTIKKATTLIYPIDNEHLEESECTFLWKEMPGALEYKFYLTTDEDFEYLEIEETTQDTFFVHQFPQILMINFGYEKYYWKVEVIYPNGNSEDNEVETIFSNYGEGVDYKKAEEIDLKAIPNPLTDKSIISFRLKEDSYCTIKIFDERGNSINLLDNQFLAQGLHNIDKGFGKIKHQLSGNRFFISLETSNNFYVLPILIE